MFFRVPKFDYLHVDPYLEWKTIWPATVWLSCGILIQFETFLADKGKSIYIWGTLSFSIAEFLMFRNNTLHDLIFAWVLFFIPFVSVFYTSKQKFSKLNKNFRFETSHVFFYFIYSSIFTCISTETTETNWNLKLKLILGDWNNNEVLSHTDVMLLLQKYLILKNISNRRISKYKWYNSNIFFRGNAFKNDLLMILAALDNSYKKNVIPNIIKFVLTN